ncbi:MAG: hypothetical protein J6W21_06500, partial [Bacteroidaceae bacterium]|nr:hypothetical protein [Bacteroidaceae bacterium]
MTGGGIADVLAHADDGQVVLQQRLVELYPRPLPAGGLVNDIDIAVVLVEVATLDDLDTHRAQIVVIYGKACEGNLVVVVATSPAHVAVLRTQHEARVADFLDTADLHQLRAHGVFLMPQLRSEPGVEHLVLREAVVGVVD